MTRPARAHSPLATPPALPALDAGTLAAAVRAWIRAARERARSRRELARMDGRLLADIGLDRETARAEAAKPFWRP